jgi:peptide deformylase
MKGKALPVLMDGHPVLRQRALLVTLFDQALCNFAFDLGATLMAERGVGIAAPQVGHSIRVILVCVNGPSAPPECMVNPVITERADTQRSTEGCLSVPRAKWFEPITRAKRIEVSFQELDGTERHMKLHGQTAAIVQHEVDHLEGILFTDYPRAGETPS